MISSFLRFLVIGFLAIVVLGVAMSVIGLAVGLASFLLFKVAPVVLIGYLAVRFLSPRRKRDELSEADRKWLQS
jgi:hypothetical protein